MTVFKKCSALVVPLLVGAATACFLLAPTRYTQSVAQGVSLWATCVMPAVFPFLFLTALFTRLKIFPRFSRLLSRPFQTLFRLSGESGCAVFLASLSGYPVGARTTLDLYERDAIDEKEAFRLACISTTSGPMFLVGVVGAGMFASPSLGWLVLCSHFLAVWTVGFCLRFGAKPPQKRPITLQNTQGNLLYDSVFQAVISILCVGATIALFFAFGEMALDLCALAGAPSSPYFTGILKGLLEMTSGCAILAKQGGAIALSLCAFLVTFGGACVLVQQLAFLSKTKIKPLRFLSIKLLQGVLAFLFCYLLCLILGV